MYQDDVKKSLLRDEEHNAPIAASHGPIHSRTRRASVLTPLFAVSLIASVLCNGYLYHTNTQLRATPDIGRSRYSGLGFDTPVTYQTNTEFNSHNTSVVNEAWESIDTSPVVIALDDAFAEAHGLERSIRFPWDETKGLYHVKGFHHMHCLKNLRRAYLDALAGAQSYISPDHFNHCLDTLRQDLMCHADDTPMPTPKKLHHIGDGQTRMCRSWDKLVEWARAPERHSCFRMADEYRSVPNTLEEFAFCAEGSENAAVADAYFAREGHRNPFGDR